MLFYDFFIIILVGIIVLLFLKSRKCDCYSNEKYTEPLVKSTGNIDDDMNLHQQLRFPKEYDYSLNCCNTPFSNNKGCLCKERCNKPIV
jgi:hypothetical protein